ncbi:hypothetical protein ROA7450_00168 [Roseovarius albus]|uniref:Uncharacterized protein n=1 Tax=Roseovarius albus TaxID=1247867 RepID=A0A1X6Y7M3_9RHOB|nr:hypothetical protein [Roseovarius albus]SLN13173.1 hypothetical protein ROA7450_00168 [Roseovarius albus]
MRNVISLSIAAEEQNRITSLSEVKLQMIHNMSMDSSLKPSACKVATFLLTAMLDKKTGRCYMSDQDLSRCVGLSLDTVRKHVKRQAAFLRYFEVQSGKNKGIATEYQITDQAVRQALMRKNKKIRNTESITDYLDSMEIRGRGCMEGNFNAFDNKGVIFSSVRREKFPLNDGKIYLPNQVENPSQNPDCADMPTQKIELNDLITDFQGLYPRKGVESEISVALEEAVEQGADTEEILRGAKLYSEQQNGNDQKYIMLPHNWLRKKRWEEFSQKSKNGVSRCSNESVFEMRANAIKSRQPWVQSSFSTHQARELIAKSLITPEECREAGFKI